MPVVKVPKTCTSITINAGVNVPNPQGEITLSESETRALVPKDHQQLWMVKSNPDGTVNLKLPPIIDSITLGGVPYGKDGNGVFLNIPGLVAGEFLGGENEQTFRYIRP